MSEIQFTGEIKYGKNITRKHLRTDTHDERGTILQKNL